MPIRNIAHVYLDDLIGYEIPKKKLITNTEAFVQGRKANNCLLFGDAGTATVVSPDDDAEDWTFAFATDGSQADATYVHVGYKYRIASLSSELKEYEDGSKRKDTDMFMDGATIFAHAYKNVPRIATELMDELETSEEDYDRLIAHQANALLVKKIGKTTYKVRVHFSNTSTATMSDKIKRMLKNEIQQM